MDGNNFNAGNVNPNGVENNNPVENINAIENPNVVENINAIENPNVAENINAIENPVVPDENLERARQLDALLSQNITNDKSFEPVKKLLESGKAENLYIAANKPDAKAEDKAKWADYTYQLHTRLNAFLSDVNAKNPARFEQDDAVANLNNAYGLNSYLCADALTKSGESVIQTCVNEAYEKANALGHYDTLKDDPEKLKAFEDALAKTLYLARLKYEYENVHGTEEEQKAWRGEILTELMSDSLNENALKYKDSDIYKTVMDNLKAYSKLKDDFRKEGKEHLVHLVEEDDKLSLNDLIQRAFKSKGESIYHGIYHHFKTEVKREGDIEEVLNATAKLDEYKAIATAIGFERTGKRDLGDVTHSPCFDTLHIKKRAKLYGKQTNYIAEKRKKEAYDRDVERYAKRYRESDEKRWVEGGKEKQLQEAQDRLALLNGILRVDENIETARNKYLESQKKERAIEDNYAQFSLVMSGTQSKITEAEIALKRAKEKKDKAGIKNNKEAIERYKNMLEGLGIQKKEFEAQKSELSEQTAELKEAWYAHISNKAALLETIYGKGYSQDVDYKEDIQKIKEEISGLRKEKEDMKQDYIKKAKDLMLSVNRDEFYAIDDEDKEYNSLTGDKRKIEEKWDTREKEFKKNNIELYHVYYPEIGEDAEGNKKYDLSKPCYISKPLKEAEIAMRDSFTKYKIKNNLNDKETDDVFEKDLQEYKALEEKYAQGPKIEKPVRNTLPVNAYKAPAVADLKIENIEVKEEEVKRFKEPERNEAVAREINPATKIENATNLVNAKLKMGFFKRKGSEEYQDILADLQKLESKMGEEHDPEYEKQILIPELRRIRIKMDDYIQRKYDEKPAREKQSSNAYQRRTNMELARTFLNDAMSSLMMKNHVTDHDYAYEDVKFAIENTRKLTKENNPDAESLYNLIAAKNKDCTQEMFKYIKSNLNNYSEKTENGRNYKFKLSESEPSGKKNLPKNPKERYFKTILLGFEKLVQSNLNHLAKEEPEKLEAVKYKLNHRDNDPTKENSMDKYLGLNIKPNEFNASLEIEKKDSLEAYSKMFDDHYKVLYSKLQYGNFKEKVTDPENYDIQKVLPNEEKKYLIESLISSVFAGYLLDKEEKALEKNLNHVSDFDFNETEKERVRFVSLIKNSGFFDKLLNNTLKMNDLKFVEGDKDQIFTEVENRKKLFGTPEKFAETILVSVISDDFVQRYAKLTENLEKGAGLDSESAKKDLTRIDMDLQLIKAAKQTEKFDTVTNKSIFNSKFKGANLSDSVKNIKKEFNNLMERKVIAPIKAVTM